jgi:hypothetical protein
MRVFYLTTAEFALSNIQKKRLKVTQIKDLNDPFELLAIEKADQSLRAKLRCKIDQKNTTSAPICFSKKWSNPVLWSHYGDRHRGIALGFDVPDEKLREIEYFKRMFEFPHSGDCLDDETLDQLVERLSYSKFDDWRYEAEYRQFFELDDLDLENTMYFAPFSDSLKLREIILGPRCETKIECMRELVNAFPEKVNVIKARIAFNRFRVVKDLRYRISDPHT